MTASGDRPMPPRLPPAGWMPDPSRTDIERYWDGNAWTLHTRDRYSLVEHGVDSWNPQPYAGKQRRRGKGRLLVLTLVFALLVVGAGRVGLLPQWVPLRAALVGAAPAAPPVDYPVFGSDELVKYLAASMIAQRGSINVSYWANADGIGKDGVFDAVSEAAIQNPNVFVDGWTYQATVTGIVIRPDYVYDDAEAEQRRAATATAVAVGLKEAGVTADLSVKQKTRAIHDYIANVAVYDSAAAEAITNGVSDTAQVEQSQEAYGILVAGTAVCNGYAQAFQLMAHAAGVPSVIVTGQATAGVTTGAHAWNQVLVDGQWRVVDVTWDDADSWGTQEEYLLVKPGSHSLSTRAADLDWVVDANASEYGG